MFSVDVFSKKTQIKDVFSYLNVRYLNQKPVYFILFGYKYVDSFLIKRVYS